jgi:hypothetical protein
MPMPIHVLPPMSSTTYLPLPICLITRLTMATITLTTPGPTALATTPSTMHGVVPMTTTSRIVSCLSNASTVTIGATAPTSVAPRTMPIRSTNHVTFYANMLGGAFTSALLMCMSSTPKGPDEGVMSQPRCRDRVIRLLLTCQTAGLLFIFYNLISSFLSIVVARCFFTFPASSPSFLSLLSPSGTFRSRLLYILLPSGTFCMLPMCSY